MREKLRTFDRRTVFLVAAICLLLIILTGIIPALRNLSQQSPCAAVEWEGETVPCPIQLTEEVYPFFGGIRFKSKIDDCSVQWVDLYILKDGVLQNTEGIRKDLRVTDNGFKKLSYRLFPEKGEERARYEIYAETDGSNGYVYQYCICDVDFGREDETDLFQWRFDLSVFDPSGTYLYTIQRSGPDPGNVSPASIVYAPSGKLFGTQKAA